MTSAAPQASVDLRFGDCLTILRTLDDESVSAVITDPPYGLSDHKPEAVTAALTAWAAGDRERVPAGRGFMSRDWDSFVPPPAVWDECMRVLKPGGHLVAFSGARTYDLMGLSIRLAGFEIRDGLQWIMGSGMPKGLNVAKATGDEHWSGWNTSLKPAVEPAVLARKPLTGTVAANVMEHRTGAINVDACRVAGPPSGLKPYVRTTAAGIYNGTADGKDKRLDAGAQVTYTDHPAGRWPSNVVLVHAESCRPPGVCDESCPVAEMDRQSGTLTSGKMRPTHTTASRSVYGQNTTGGYTTTETYGDSGGASRFFPSFRYQAKASASERPKIDGKGWPTVKPLALMRWLVRLVTPPEGLVLDPFAGTGPTLQAARDEGFASIGIERDEFAYLLSCRRLGLPELVPATVRDAGTGAPVSLTGRTTARAQLGGLRAVVRMDPLLVAIAEAESLERIDALYEEHRVGWRDVHTAAVKVRLPGLEPAA